MMPVKITASPTDMWYQQVTLRVMDISGIEFLYRPGTRLDGPRFHVFVPFKRTHDIACLIERKLGYTTMQEYHIMVTASTGVAVPFRTGITHKFAVLVDLIDEFDRLVPACLGNIEVVGGIAQHIKPGDVTPIGQVVGRIIGANGIIGMHMEIAKVITRIKLLV